MSNSFSIHDVDGVDPFGPFGRWDESSQYAPTPCNFGWTPASSSSLNYTNVDPSTVEYPASQPNAPQTNRLLLLQFGDWDEGQAYDEDPPTCIHYSIEWKVTLNNRTMAKDTEQNLVLAPKSHWRVFLEPKLKELLCRKYPHRRIVYVGKHDYDQRKLFSLVIVMSSCKPDSPTDIYCRWA